MRRSSIIAGFLTVATVAAAYAELVADVRARRSAIKEQHVIAASVSFLTADYDRVRALMKQKYGERAVTTLADWGDIEVKVDGKRVHEEKFVMTIENVFGAFFIGPDGNMQQKFPFDILAGRLPVSPDSVASLTSRLKRRFSARMGAILDSVSEGEWSQGPCKIIEPADLGFGRLTGLLRLEAATRCLSSWKGPNPGTSLFVLVQARGDPWMRPLSRRICRVFGASVLTDFAVGEAPDYFGCLLIDRPERSGTQQVLTPNIFQVGPDRALARLN